MMRQLEPRLHTDLTELQERVLDYIDSSGISRGIKLVPPAQMPSNQSNSSHTGE